MWAVAQRLANLSASPAEHGGAGGLNVKVAYATHEPPSLLAGEGLGERETVMTFMIWGAWKSHDR